MTSLWLLVWGTWCVLHLDLEQVLGLGYPSLGMLGKCLNCIFNIWFLKHKPSLIPMNLFTFRGFMLWERRVVYTWQSATVNPIHRIYVYDHISVFVIGWVLYYKVASSVKLVTYLIVAGIFLLSFFIFCFSSFLNVDTATNNIYFL